MKRRTVIGLAAGAAVSLAAGAGALAFGGGPAGARHAIMRRVITATIDEALDRAQVTPEQRQTINAARDRVFATVDAERAGRQTHLEEALRLFESDQPDPAQVEALHGQGEEGRQRIRQAIHEAIVQAHDVLTPAQRKALTDYIRAHRLAHLH
jgi:Spy/CpxP family protein refolding chaperone